MMTMLYILALAAAAPPPSPWAGVILLGLVMIAGGLWLRRKGL